MAFAKVASERSDYPQHKLGCAISYHKSIVSTGWNSAVQTHPTQKHFNQFRKSKNAHWVHKLHAEIKAIEAVRHLDIDWKKATLYIYRQHANGECALARPCAACLKAIQERGIRKICYTNSNELGYTVELVS